MLVKKGARAPELLTAVLVCAASGSGFYTELPQAPLGIREWKDGWLFENCESIPHLEPVRVKEQCQPQIMSESFFSPRPTHGRDSD